MGQAILDPQKAICATRKNPRKSVAPTTHQIESSTLCRSKTIRTGPMTRRTLSRRLPRYGLSLSVTNSHDNGRDKKVTSDNLCWLHTEWRWQYLRGGGKPRPQQPDKLVLSREILRFADILIAKNVSVLISKGTGFLYSKEGAGSIASEESEAID
jgi:hypothetical protein